MVQGIGRRVALLFVMTIGDFACEDTPFSVKRTTFSPFDRGTLFF